MSGVDITFDLAVERPGFRLAATGRIDSPTTALFGPSGAGKTTLLRCLAGLEPDCRGTLREGDRHWQTADTFCPPHRRSVGLVGRETRLFAHLSVRQNLDYAERRRRGRGPDRAAVIDALALRSLLDEDPAALSGPAAQRVVLGRALLAGPRVLLLDEPLMGLDATNRTETVARLRAVSRRLGVPLIVATHDREAVLALADQLLLMRDGEVRAAGPVSELFSEPAHWAVLGQPEPVVIWPGRVVARDNDWGLTTLATDAGRLRVSGIMADPGDEVVLRVGARDVVLTLEPPRASSALNSLPVRVEALERLEEGRLRVRLGVGHRATLWTEVTRQSVAALRLEAGRRLHALIRPEVIGINH
jgi:molybdate transport system ATP-binding protein